MPLNNKPTFDELVNRSRADVKATLPDVDPYNPNGTINAELVAFGGRKKEQYDQLDIIVDNTFIATSDAETLNKRGAEFNLTLNPATSANGVAIFTGTLATIIAQGTEVQSSEGNIYKTETSVTIANNTLNIDSIERIGTTATVTVNAGHALGSGMNVTVSGAVETDYNGAFDIIVSSITQFTYEVENSPTTPATGTLIVDSLKGNVNVISDDKGQDQNLIGGTQLTLVVASGTVDSAVKTTFSGIDSGTDIETTEEFRTRILFRKRNPITNFNVSNIKKTAGTVSGVTRTFVYEAQDLPRAIIATSAVATSSFVTLTLPTEHDIRDGQSFTITGANEPAFNGTYGVVVIDDFKVGYYATGTLNVTATGTITAEFSAVQLGQVAVYFVRDNDMPIIPSGQEVTDVKNALLEIKPADMSSNDLLVRAPTEVSTAFAFTSLIPDTTGLRESIEINLASLFDGNDLGNDVTETQYRTAIQTSFDPETNSIVQSFTISVSGDITADFNEILTLGTVSY
jgi:uncharacterized phage protein gp47/JayE